MKTIREIQKLADKYTDVGSEDLHDGYVDGYTQCQADKLERFTKEDMISFHRWMLAHDTEKNSERYFHFTDSDMLNEYLNHVLITS